MQVSKIPIGQLNPAANTSGIIILQGYRNFIGFEISEEYCEKARKRIAEYTQ